MAKLSNHLWDAFAAVFIVAVIYLLVKPSSLGPALVKSSSEGLAALITYSVAG